ncbi:MAG: T9SS type A sorting domain-containing protein [Bacteroidota bacterium]
MKKLYILGLLSLLFFTSFGQLADVNYTVQTVNVTSYEGGFGGPCWESGNEEYTAYVGSYDNVNGTATSTGCQTCDNNGNCSYAGGITLQSRTNNAYSIFSTIDAWEDDGGSRCGYDGGDDCRRQETASYNFREFAFPSNGAYTNGPTWGGTNNHQWTIRTTWRYAGTANLIIPGCGVQTTAYAAGAIRSWSVNLTAGVVYNFNNCTSASSDTYLRIYGPDGYTNVANGDDNCGVLSSINYTPGATGTYYIELAQFSRGALAAGGTLSYSIVAPTTSTNGGNVTLCQGTNSAGLAGSAPTVGTGTWTASSGLVSFSGINTPNSTLSSGTSGTYTATWTINNGGCTSASSLTATINSNTNNPGVITAPASICVGSPASISNVTAATTGAPASAGPNYYYYWQRTSAPVVGWTMYDGPTSALTSALPAAVTGTAGTYLLARNSEFGCVGQVSAPFLNLTVNAAATLGTLSNAGPINFCDAGGNFTTAVNVSGQTGAVMWDWGSNNGVWNNNWVAGANSGVCCFPKKISNSDGNADRIRYRVTNGVCPSVTSGTILIQNRYNEAPTSLASSTSIYCAGAGPANITLTATFPANINMNGTVRFYSGSCGGTLVGNVSPSATSATAAVTIAAPAGTTTYYARYEPGAGTGCANTACVQTTVTVQTLSVAPTSIVGTTTICAGGNTTLTLSGGTAGTGATAQWFAGSCGSAVIGTGNSIVVSPGSTTTYFVRYTGTCNTTACASVAVTVQTLSVAPTSIVGTTTICAGGNTTLTLSGGTAGTGATAQWFAGSCGSAVIGTGNSIVVSPGSTTTYFVRYTGTCNTTACASVAVTVQTLSVAPTSIVGTTTICAGGNTTLTLSGGTAGTGATAQWFAGSCGSAVIGTGNSIVVSPGSTTTYFVRYAGTCNTTACASVVVNVNTISTAPTITPVAGTVCPNTNVTLTAAGGTAGTGSTINWYTGANGSGTFLGSGASIVVVPNASATYYARREGACNNSTDATVTVNVKTFYYAANGTSGNSYCTDNAGWHHFYNGSEILFSVQGDISAAPPGFPVASINVNGSYYQQTEGPGTPAGCASNIDPNEERFEMARSWNLDMGGGAPSGTYNIRFYYPPAERTAIETAAANHLATYPACGYTYKYATPLGFYWFKNSGSNYSAPLYDATHYSGSGGTAPGGVNYAQWTGITGFSGGSGAVILSSVTELPIELNGFSALCSAEATAVNVQWSTASEHNSSHFVVDRSFDATSWTAIGTIQAAGNSTVLQEYSLIDDATVIRGHDVIYYRLNQFDNDGVSKIYGPTSAECSNDMLGMELFPNPASDLVNVLLHDDITNETSIVFTDVQGKEVKRIICNEQIGKLYTVDLTGMNPGVYIVRLMDGKANGEFVRFVKR